MNCVDVGAVRTAATVLNPAGTAPLTVIFCPTTNPQADAVVTVAMVELLYAWAAAGAGFRLECEPPDTVNVNVVCRSP